MHKVKLISEKRVTTSKSGPDSIHFHQQLNRGKKRDIGRNWQLHKTLFDSLFSYSCIDYRMKSTIYLVLKLHFFINTHFINFQRKAAKHGFRLKGFSVGVTPI